jgi:hypothetical protein
MNTPQPVVPSATPDVPIRILYMVLFGFAFSILCWVLAVVAIFQLIVRVTSGSPRAEFTRFGEALALYSRQVIEYLTFVSEVLPFPFGAWPGEA